MLADQSAIDRYLDCERTTWSLLVERHQRAVGTYACGEYLNGLARLGPCAGALVPLDTLNTALARLTPWRLITSSGLADDAFFFRATAERQFPVAIEVRTREELAFAALPDMFHDVYGHAPYLLTPRGALAHRMFGEVARAGDYAPTLVQRLSTLFWFTFEVGLVREAGAVKVLGAAILTSAEETRNIGRGCDIAAFDLDRVLETSFQPRSLQPRYFLLSSLSEIFVALRRLTPRCSR